MKKRVYLILLFVILAIFLIVSVCIFFKKDTNQANNEEIEEGYNESKLYFGTIDFQEFASLIESKATFIVAIDDNSSFMYENFKELINKLSYKYEIDLKYLEASKISKEDEALYFEFIHEINDYQYPIMVVFKDKEVIKINDTDFEKFIKDYKNMKE